MAVEVDARWDALEHALLAGLTHAMSNRAASVAAIASLAEPGQPWTPRLGGMLDAEAANLESLVRGMRLLTTDPALGAETIELGAVVPALVALHAQHPELRDVECVVEREGVIERDIVTPVEFVRRVLLEVDAAKREAQARGGRAVVRWGGDPAVTVGVEGGAPPGPDR
jgi:hypothetical protein